MLVKAKPKKGEEAIEEVAGSPIGLVSNNWTILSGNLSEPTDMEPKVLSSALRLGPG